MRSTEPLKLLLLRLWRHIEIRRRKQFILLLLLMVCASFAEILSIGAVLPFLAVLTMPTRVFEHPMAQPYLSALGITTEKQLLLPLTMAFCASTLLAGGMRLMLLWANMRLSYAAGADLSNNIYRYTLYQPYQTHLARNSSDVITGILVKANGVIACVITPMLTLISAMILLAAILITLLTVDPIIAMFSFGGFGLIYVSISKYTRARVLRNSQRVASESSQITKTLQEGLGGIREVLLGESQTVYCQQYRNADFKLRRAQSDNAFIIGSPRYAMETLGIILIAMMAYLLTMDSDGAGAIPVLGALALGAQRMLPALQQAYGSWTSIRGEQASLQDTLELLDQPLPNSVKQPNSASINFQKQIKLNSIYFRYGRELPWILKDLNLTIAKGSRTGLIGSTGSGKSTLLDIVMGLLAPTEGALYVDDKPISEADQRHWKSHIASVSQTIFLTDNTIAENIAFGVPVELIDQKKVEIAAKQAHIANTIETWPSKYQSIVGERGVRLSGGQRQRIGIARALYKQADVIIFDEATSALDNETEIAVMQAIEEINKEITIIIIAHRLTTLKKCTQIVELEGGGIKNIGTYNDMVNVFKQSSSRNN